MDGCCVVCRRPLTPRHRCPPRTLAGKRGAETRAENETDPLSQTIPVEFDERRKLFGTRLRLGFAMLNEDGDLGALDLR